MKKSRCKLSVTVEKGCDMKPYILTPVLLALCFIALTEASPNPDLFSSFKSLFNSGECKDCVCGVKKGMRIVGGTAANIRNYPWLVKINHNGRQWCGGTLITRRHILTAAHCVYQQSTSSFTVHLTDGQHSIRTIRHHRRYNSVTYDNDIAIIELYMPVSLSSKVKTICLPEPDEEFDGEIGIATGWGATYGGDRYNTDLRTVELPVMSESQCSRSWYGSGQVTDNMFCAGFIAGGKDTCQGDSGGPLEVHRDGGSTVLAGVVSWGGGCAKYGYPGVYTKVSRYIDWIKTYTYNECLCPSLRN